MTTQNITSIPFNSGSLPAAGQSAALVRPVELTPYAMGVQLMLVSPADVQRPEVEEFIKQQYRQHYAAQLNEFFPIILAVRELNSGRLMGAVGLRYADEQPLFSEQYLNQSIEGSIADKENLNVTRHSIIELGHFAVAQPVDVNTVIPLIGRFLKSLDVSWAVYTLSRPIKVAFARLGIQLTHLQHAHQGSLKSHPSDWGRYYDFKPAVYYSSILNNMNAG